MTRPGEKSQRVSSLWTLVPWLLPSWLIPAWVWEKVERAVYDGMTRREWTDVQVNQLHEAQRNKTRAARDGDA